MNIFLPFKEYKLSAKTLSDQHLVKQILELGQLLCTALSERPELTPTVNEVPYKATHVNHPVTIWIKNPANYNNMIQYFIILSKEYEYRFNKTHKTYTQLASAGMLRIDPKHLSQRITEFPIKNGWTTLEEKYKEWINRENFLIPKWTNREIPLLFIHLFEEKIK